MGIGKTAGRGSQVVSYSNWRGGAALLCNWNLSTMGWKEIISVRSKRHWLSTVAMDGGERERPSTPSKPSRFSVYQNPALSAVLTANSLRPSKSLFLSIFFVSTSSAVAFLGIISRYPLSVRFASQMLILQHVSFLQLDLSVGLFFPRGTRVCTILARYLRIFVSGDLGVRVFWGFYGPILISWGEPRKKIASVIGYEASCYWVFIIIYVIRESI